MSAGRPRGWWRHEVVKPAHKEEEDKDGRLKSEGSERRVPSEGHASTSDRIKI
tara:strand:- start:76 stop:234 length:159 start_codon:yes stop_codon:yes gene_type:complete